jgi:hypothetical protein
MRIALIVAILTLPFITRIVSRFLKPKRQFKTTDALIQYLSSAAVDDARINNQTHLDYSIDSIHKVESILGQLHEKYSKDPNSISVTGLSSAYGAYIGEVIRRSEPNAHWERDHEVAGEKSYPLTWSGGDSFPMGWCYKRIVDGEEDNVWVKYSIISEGYAKLVGK